MAEFQNITGLSSGVQQKQQQIKPKDGSPRNVKEWSKSEPNNFRARTGYNVMMQSGEGGNCKGRTIASQPASASNGNVISPQKQKGNSFSGKASEQHQNSAR